MINMPQACQTHARLRTGSYQTIVDFSPRTPWGCCHDCHLTPRHGLHVFNDRLRCLRLGTSRGFPHLDYKTCTCLKLLSAVRHAGGQLRLAHSDSSAVSFYRSPWSHRAGSSFFSFDVFVAARRCANLWRSRLPRVRQDAKSQPRGSRSCKPFRSERGLRGHG